MFLSVVAILAVALTVAMFATKQSMLGFPCFIFWSLLGGDAYTLSTTTWDMYYLLFFASIGMAIFCAFAAFGLRTKKEDMQAGEEYVDESRSGAESVGDRPDRPEPDMMERHEADNFNDRPSRRVRIVRDRAARRREQGVSVSTRWGDLK